MNYSMYLCLSLATLPAADSTDATDADAQLDEVLEPIHARLRTLLQDFANQPASAQAAFEFERQLQAELRELGRVGTEWAYNHVEPADGKLLPLNVEFETGVYTRIKRKTPQTVATLFGKIDFRRYGYRPTQKTGDATIFPLAQQLGIVAAASLPLEAIGYALWNMDAAFNSRPISNLPVVLPITGSK